MVGTKAAAVKVFRINRLTTGHFEITSALRAGDCGIGCRVDAIQMSGVTKNFGELCAVNDLSLAVPRGCIYGFIGPNGSGKTTTMRMAIDLIRPDSGSVALLGGMPTREALRRIGYLPEERGLFKRARVIDALRYLGRLKGLDAKGAGRRC